ncbi:MAG: hypothetical protein IIV43_09075, partial [Oscillospiraceae bacterium]|nr:hypothetical protein [Oscillospiraceae bacterium]
MENKSSVGTLGYAIGAGVLVIVLLLVLGISTGFLPWRDSYAESPRPSNEDDVVVPITTDIPQDDILATPTPTPTPSPTPMPTPTVTPGVTLDEELPTHIVTVAFGKGGTAIPYGANTVVENGSIIVVAVPDEGYVVEEMIVDGVVVGAVDKYEIESVNRNHSIYISFMKEKYAEVTPTPTPTPTPQITPTPVPEVSGELTEEVP